MSTHAEEACVPVGWFMAGSHPREYEAQVDREVVHGGKASCRLRFVAERSNGFGTLMQQFDAGRFHERRIRLSAWIKAVEVDGWAGLWMRVDGQGGKSLAFDNMQNRSIRGTLDWQRYEVVLDVAAGSVQVAFGVLLSGTGTVWVDDCAFEEVGLDVPSTNMPGRDVPKEPRNLGFEE